MRFGVALEYVARTLQRLALLIRRQRELFALLAVERAAGARLDALAFHRRIKAQTLVARQIFDEVARQAVAVVQLERFIARHDLAGFRGTLEHLFEPGQ